MTNPRCGLAALFAFATASIADTAGGAFDALYGDLFGEPLSAIPAA